MKSFGMILVLAEAARAVLSPAVPADSPERLVLSRGGARFTWRRGRPFSRSRFFSALGRRDVLADDGLALIDHLGLDAYHLGGYSLGGKLVLRLLDSFVTTPRDALAQVPTPTLVVAGEGDSRGASAGELAALLPNGQVALIPGDHLTAIGAPEFTDAILNFLK